MKNLINLRKKDFLEDFFTLKSRNFGGNELFGIRDAFLDSLTHQRFEVHDDKERFAIKTELPGYTLKDISVHAQNGILSIKARKQEKKEVKQKGYYQFERRYRSFQRSFALPKEADGATLKTSFQNGKLEISLNKRHAN